MKKVIGLAYSGVLILVVILLLVAGFTLKDEEYNLRDEQGYKEITEYQSRWEYDGTLPCGGKDVASFKIDELGDYASNLCFFSIHQSVYIYIDDELIYSLIPSEKNYFSKTTGNNWVSIPLTQSDVGKTVTIELIPAYDDYISVIPDFYVGNKWDVFVMSIKQNVIAFILSLMAMIIGLGFLAWALYNRKDKNIEMRLLHLGGFAFWIGLWKFTDLESLSLFVPRSYGMSTIPCLALFLLVVPFVFFFRGLFKDEMEILTEGICIVSVMFVAIAVIMQLIGICDIRELLYVDHLIFGGIIFVGFYMIYTEIKNNGISKELLVSLVCLFSALMGTVVDLAIFYASNGKNTSYFGILSFLVYIIIQGIINVHETVILMEKGRKASHYKNMAYHDQLTALYTRSAFAEYIEPGNFTPDDSVVIMCDLNNLKKCNDTLGHEAGDRYLIQSTNLLRRVFKEYGPCFRMGGDEFCVLVSNRADHECEKVLETLKREEENYNRENTDEFPIHIAAGFARFDSSIDVDINDTIKRADAKMYMDKVNAKANRRD